jgi:hypothetical protein
MDARFFLSSANHFIEHPDSIAGRLARWQLDRVLNQLSKRTGIGQWPAQPIPDNCPKRLRLRSAAIIPDCPLGSCWRDWDMFGTLDKYFRFVSDEQKAQCQEARVRAPSRHLGRIGLEWEATWIEPGVGNRKGTFDGHVHAEATIETRLVPRGADLCGWRTGRSRRVRRVLSRVRRQRPACRRDSLRLHGVECGGDPWTGHAGGRTLGNQLRMTVTRSVPPWPYGVSSLTGRTSMLPSRAGGILAAI